MAWDLVFSAEAGHGTAVAFITGIDGAATPDLENEQYVLNFDPSNDNAAIFRGVVPEGYASGSSTTVDIYWHASTATGSSVNWEVYFMRCQDVTTDISSTAQFNSTGVAISDTAHSTVKYAQAVSGTITNANMDAVAAGEEFLMLVVRDAAGDANTGITCLRAVKLSQT